MNFRLALICSLLLLNIACSTGSSSVRKSHDLSFKNHLVGIVAINGYEPDLAEGIVAGELLKLGAEVIERSQISIILAEQRFLLSGLIRNEDAIEIGKIIGVHSIFIGSVSRPSISNTANWKDNTWQNFVVVFTGRLIDVESGKVLLSGQATGKRGYANMAVIQSIENFFNAN